MFYPRKMFSILSGTILRNYSAVFFLALVTTLTSYGQEVGTTPYKSQEVSDVDGLPVLVKHLPDWENRRQTTAFATNTDELRRALGDRPLLEVIEFAPGTEAATAQYDEGRLLIVEHASPQVSIEADQKIAAAIAANDDGKTYNRRIGNYNVVLFDANGSWSASSLIDQVKYEKDIQWLGKNPFAISAERAFVMTTADIFFSTMMVIVGGAVSAVLAGLVIGYFFFFFRDGKRNTMTAYSDAGGMTRLNLDGFSEDISSERLLRD